MMEGEAETEKDRGGYSEGAHSRRGGPPAARAMTRAEPTSSRGACLRGGELLLLWIVRSLGGAQVAQQPALFVLVPAAMTPRAAAAMIVIVPVIAALVAIPAVVIVVGVVRLLVAAAAALSRAVHPGIVMKTGVGMANIRETLPSRKNHIQVVLSQWRVGLF